MIKEKTKKQRFRLRKLETENEEDIAFEVVDKKTGKVQCRMRMCENPLSGDIDFVFGKGCPLGTVEKVAGKIATRTLRFISEKEHDEE